jgi:sarcosine oxidase, subunit beta
MNSSNADVLIVGGGIMGTSSAFFLRRRGRSAILLERGLVGQQASGVNFGAVRRLGRFLPQLPLSTRAREIWARLPELIGHDCEFQPSGLMRVCYSEEQADLYERYGTDAAQYGLSLEMYRGRAMRAKFPFLGSDVLAAQYSATCGHANPRLAAPAIGRAAAREGAQIVENTEVVRVEKDGDTFRATCADGRCFSAPNLLITAGAWAGQLSAQFGEPVPMSGQGPQMGVTEPMPYGIVPVVNVSSERPEEVIYFRQVKRGNIVFGGGRRTTAQLDERRVKVAPENTLYQLERLSRLAPALAGLNLLRVWSGVEGYLSDELPVVSASRKVDGLFYAFGFCGHGFQLGPGVGDVMAEWIDTGRTSTPLQPFDIGRFAASDPLPTRQEVAVSGAH